MDMEEAKRILIIDDDEYIRDIFQMWLEREGYEVHLAENGRVGIETQNKYPSTLVICDLIMPEQEGIETIGLLRRDFPDVGIIAISGGGKIDSESYLNIAGQLGAWKVFSKPLIMEKIVQAINEWMSGKR